MRHNPLPVTDNRRLSQYADERDPDVFWAAVRPEDEPVRHRWFLPAVVVILIVSVPWYLPPSVGDRLAGGLPVWTWVTILCGLALAAVTAFASLRLWRDGADEAGGDDPEERATGGDAGTRAATLGPGDREGRTARGDREERQERAAGGDGRVGS